MIQLSWSVVELGFVGAVPFVDGARFSFARN